MKKNLNNDIFFERKKKYLNYLFRKKRNENKIRLRKTILIFLF